MNQQGDSQPRVFLHPFLQGVGEFGHGARAAVLTWFTRAGHFSQAVLQQRRSAIGKERAFLIDEDSALVLREAAVLPSAFHLCDLFFESHAPEQIGNAFFDASFSVTIGRSLLRNGRVQ